MPTLACSWQGCDRTFTTAEQSKKHEKTHSGKSQYSCSVCGKRYSRSDVLSRHSVQAHGFSPPAIGRPRKVPCSACLGNKVVCDGVPPNPCTRCRTVNTVCTYDKQVRRSASPARSTSDQRGSRDVSGMPSTPGFLPNTPNVSAPSASSARINSTTPSHHNPIQNFQPPPIQAIANDLVSPTTSQNAFSWTSMFDIGQISEQPIDWGLGEFEGNMFDVLNAEASNSPSSDFFAGLADAEPAIPTSSTQGDWFQSPESLYGQPQEIPDGQPYDSAWPHIDKPRTPDASVSSPATQGVHSTYFPSSFEGSEEVARQSMLLIMLQSHRAVWPPVDTTNFPPAETLTVCVNSYYKHFHAWSPIIESSAPVTRDANPLSLMAMSAIGAMYSRDGSQRSGIALNELVRRATSYIRENDRRFMYETHIIQAFLSQSYFGFFCGSQKAFQQSESAVGALVMACKRMHSLRPGQSAIQALHARNPEPDQDEVAKAEREDRRRARLGWGIYSLDSQLPLLNLPHHLMMTDINAPFPSMARSRGEAPWSVSFHDVVSGFLTTGVPPVALDDLGFCVIAYTSYRSCADAARSEIPKIANDQIFQKYRLFFPPSVNHHPQLLSDRIAAHTLNHSAPASALLISSAALASCSHSQFTINGFIEMARGAAGKAGTIASLNSSREALSQVLNRNIQAARNIFVHAAMSGCLTDRFTHDTPSEAVWTFNAALSLWAVQRFCERGVATPGSGIVISWSAIPEFDQWVSHGGPASIQGLGDVYGSTDIKILTHFMSKLEGLSWGSAQQYRAVSHNSLAESQLNA